MLSVIHNWWVMTHIWIAGLCSESYNSSWDIKIKRIINLIKMLCVSFDADHKVYVIISTHMSLDKNWLNLS